MVGCVFGKEAGLTLAYGWYSLAGESLLMVVPMPAFTVSCHTRPILFPLKEKGKEGLTGNINHLIDLGS